MIHQIYSDLPTFKNLQFRSGLNIILADKSPGATNRQTRNGAGKTSLIELIHFLTGANCDKESIFKTKQLAPFNFSVDFDLKGIRTIIRRSGENSSKLVLERCDSNDWPVKPSIDKNTRELIISNVNWKIILGSMIFNLKSNNDEESSDTFCPSFRSLFSYFVRRQSSKGFNSPEKTSEMQQIWDQQVAISYLLGLDWTIAQQWQVVRNREKTLKELKKAASTGSFGPLISTVADLRTKLTVAEERSRQLKDNVSKFRVLAEYHALEVEASKLTRQLGSMADDNIVDRHLLTDLKISLESETDPSFNDLEHLYKEVGIVLPEVVIRRFEDVRKFHESVIDNRKSYLTGEIQSVKYRIAKREENMTKFDARRSEIMHILNSHGALEQFTRLQSELVRQEAETESIRQQFIVAEQMEGQKTELEIERGRLLLRLQQDYKEQSDILGEAIIAFEKISSALYEKAGSLTISELSNGPSFKVHIHGQKSKGIENMQIFCFDMMLMKLCAERGLSPGFLIHDSHLFDGVDERQIATALQIGANTAREFHFQYIVTMNSDAMPKNFPDNFQIDDYILPVRLTDATDDGGLFGIRFS